MFTQAVAAVVWTLWAGAIGSCDTGLCEKGAHLRHHFEWTMLESFEGKEACMMGQAKQAFLIEWSLTRQIKNGRGPFVVVMCAEGEEEPSSTVLTGFPKPRKGGAGGAGL